MTKKTTDITNWRELLTDEVAGMLAKGKVKEAYEWANTKID